MKRIYCAAMIAISGLFSQSPLADDVTLRIGAGHPSVMTYVNIWDTYFANELIERAADIGHNVRLVRAWGTATGVEGVLDVTASGALDIGIIATVFEPSRLELLNAAYLMPFSTPDPILQTKIFNQLIRENEAFSAAVASYGLTILGVMATENYGMPMRNIPSGVDSVRGLRIAAGAVNAPWSAAVGAVPVAIPVNQNYEAISSGLLDGNIIFVSAMETFNFHELFDAFFKTDFGAMPGYLAIMNSTTRARLPEELVTLIDEVAQETVAELAAISADKDASFKEIAESHGVTIVQIASEEKETWAEAILPNAEEKIAEMESRGVPAQSVMLDYIRYLGEAGHEFPVTFSFEN